MLTGGLAAALLLLVAEFMPLYNEDSAASRIPLRTVQTGSHHAYALIPVALLAVALAVGASRSASRPGMLALAVLGIVTAMIALIVDLPDAHASGLAGSVAAGFSTATDVPQAGLYLETLGAVLLVVTGGAGLLLSSAPRARTAAA